jgi:hypothetical protein
MTHQVAVVVRERLAVTRQQHRATVATVYLRAFLDLLSLAVAVAVVESLVRRAALVEREAAETPVTTLVGQQEPSIPVAVAVVQVRLPLAVLAVPA